MYQRLQLSNIQFQELSVYRKSFLIQIQNNKIYLINNFFSLSLSLWASFEINHVTLNENRQNMSLSQRVDSFYYLYDYQINFKNLI